MTLFWTVVLVFWLAAMAVWWGGSRVLRSTEVTRMRNRLLGSQGDRRKKAGAAPPALIRAEDRSKGKIVLRVLGRFRMQVWLQNVLEQAGLKWNPGRLVHGCLGLFLGAYLTIWGAAPAPWDGFAVLGAVLGGVLPLLHVLRKRRSRLRQFEEQFPESLEFVARSMRAGHAFSVSLEMLHREFQDPLAGEFRRTFDEHNLGLPLDVALEKLARRVPLMDVHFFVSAVMLQKRTGGNLAELLDKLAYLIRERFKLRGRIRAVSAHGRMTGGALTTIPILVAALMFFVNRSYVTFFITDATGQVMMAAAAALQMLGYVIIRKIVSIEV